MKINAQHYYEHKRTSLPNAELRSQTRTPFSEIDPSLIKTIHITAVCGTAMASLADLLIKKGFTVTGSDSAYYPPMSDVIKNLGIEMRLFDIKNVIDADIVVIGNMCPPSNIEASYCRENNIRYFSVGEVLSALCIEDKKSIVMTGTHGKTTTTGLAIAMLEKLARTLPEYPSYLVGGAIKQTGKSAVYRKESEFFIIEGDEYDTAYFDKAPKFLHYKPFYAVITSIELDHIDIYKDITDYEQAFLFLIEEVHDDGVIFACIDTAGVQNLLEKVSTHKKIITYGKNSNAAIHITSIITTETGQEITYQLNGATHHFILPMFGEYNALNATAVHAIGLQVGFNPESLSHAFDSYGGMKRRQEIYGEKNGITVIDDFAHHPTAVAKTLKGLRERFGERRIVAIFEPRSNTSRAKMYEEEYAHAFSNADIVYISTPPVKIAGYNPSDFMDIEYVSNIIKEQGKIVYATENAAAILEIIKPTLKSGDVLVVMSNGSFDGIHQKLLDLIPG